MLPGVYYIRNLLVERWPVRSLRWHINDQREKGTSFLNVEAGQWVCG